MKPRFVFVQLKNGTTDKTSHMVIKGGSMAQLFKSEHFNIFLIHPESSDFDFDQSGTHLFWQHSGLRNEMKKWGISKVLLFYNYRIKYIHSIYYITIADNDAWRILPLIYRCDAKWFEHRDSFPTSPATFDFTTSCWL